MPWAKIKPEIDEPEFDSELDKGLRKISYPEAIREALSQALEIDPTVFLMGQGVDDPMGMFGTTLDLHKKFGNERVFDTPLSENALTGMAIGAAIGGMRPVYFHNRPDFLLLAMDQIVNHASKWYYMFGGEISVPLVIWACIGRGWGSAAQHSQAIHALFMHIPGLKLIMPSTCYDAKGLMLSAIADNNPVIIIEHRFNFRHKGYVPEYPYKIPFGRGVIRKKGKDLTIVAISYMVTEAFQAAIELQKEGIDAEVIDLRTLKPIDKKIIIDSVSRTNRLVIADLGWKACGVASEITTIVIETDNELLKAPIRRITCPDLPTPAGYTLEEAFYPGKEDIIRTVKEIIR